jgi:acyl-lipid Delta6-acetylenase / acyl-lipid (9-3)-desaturase
MISAGLFKLNKFYYLYKFASQILLVGAAAYAASIPGSVGYYVGAILLGLFWQQSGWLCHDLCHNQLCELKDGRALSVWNHALGMITGNLSQGFSVKWWKDKHNRHHAVPNVHGGEFNTMNADPDIDTMPLLAWSRKMAALGKDSQFGRFMISIQKFTYMPLLCIARFSWLLQSIQFAWSIKGNGVFENASKSEDLERAQENYLVGPAKTFEQTFIVLHHLWVFLLCAQRGSILEALSFWMLAQVTCGFLLFSVTSLGHNGLPVYEADERPDYWKLQVTTTRNITGNWFVHWLCGGLEYQVDHHLFPMMPRHSLPAAHEIIVAFCKEHDLKFNEDNLFHGTIDILKHLDVVAKDFLHDFPGI